MNALLPVVLAVLAGLAWWIAQSAVRIAAAVALAALTHHAPLGLAVLLAVALVGLAGWIVWRALAPCGWRLVVTTAPGTAPTS